MANKTKSMTLLRENPTTHRVLALSYERGEGDGSSPWGETQTLHWNLRGKTWNSRSRPTVSGTHKKTVLSQIDYMFKSAPRSEIAKTIKDLKESLIPTEFFY